MVSTMNVGRRTLNDRNELINQYEVAQRRKPKQLPVHHFECLTERFAFQNSISP